MIKKKKVLEWIYRILLFSFFDLLISGLGFVAIYYPMLILIETNNFNLGTQIGLLQMAIAISFLKVANLFYWIMNINLFDFKLLFKDKKC